MSDPQLDPHRQMKFDVPAWVAVLAGCPRAEVVFASETESDGFLTVTYARRGKPLATVDLVGVPVDKSTQSFWQLFAQVGPRVERAQVPASTEFTWR